MSLVDWNNPVFYLNNSLTLESSLFNLDTWRCRLSAAFLEADKKSLVCVGHQCLDNCNESGPGIFKFLSHKGWFTPPFETFASLKERLENDYVLEEYHKEGSMVCLRARTNLGYPRYSEGDSPRYRWTYRLK